MRDLHGHVGRRRHHLAQEQLGVAASVLWIHRPQMNDDGQPSRVRCLEHGGKPVYVLGVAKIEEGGGEMHLEPPNTPVPRTGRHLLERVRPKWVEAAERNEAVW